MKKYKLLADDTILLFGITLYRIRALKDFGNVKKRRTWRLCRKRKQSKSL